MLHSNLEGVDLLMGSRGDNLYTLSRWEYDGILSDLSIYKASKYHPVKASSSISLNFGAIINLQDMDLSEVSLSSRLKDHLCSQCIRQKFKKPQTNPYLRNNNQEKTLSVAYGSVWDNAVTSVNGKSTPRYCPDDYSIYMREIGQLQPKADMVFSLEMHPQESKPDLQQIIPEGLNETIMLTLKS
ncbi:hypothetical protein Tco_1033044 [Tanacetum coccineum]|uniref:Uncharacterized protein n=1 Tax=Tanacetum coccineum TaxID=301880 RepID=A0ABQ5GEJ5_9ASTR